jgi:hypothetical protein
VIDEDITDNRAYFQVFGVYHTEYDLWLSWPSVVEIAHELGFPTVPVVTMTNDHDEGEYTHPQNFIRDILTYGESIVDDGGEGLIVRSKFPFHYGQFGTKLGKYVRPNHVKTAEHWKHTEVIENNLYRN